MNTYIVVYFDNQSKNMHNFQTEAEDKSKALLNFYNQEKGTYGMPVNIINLGELE